MTSNEQTQDSRETEKIHFLEEKIRELDKAIADLETTDDLQAFGDYVVRMKGLEEKKAARLLAAEKRYQFQHESLRAQFQSKIQAIIDESLVKDDKVQNVYGKRRGMIRVDSFLEQMKQARISQETPDQDSPASTKNWLEDDLHRITGHSMNLSPISSA